ncbi:MAG: M20 family metallopeptidase [Nakamurella sp.]
MRQQPDARVDRQVNASALLPRLRSVRDRIVADVAELVACESPSDNVAAIAACVELVGELGRELTGAAPQLCTEGGRAHLLWRLGGPTQVLLVGHCDTVWPVGTVARWPFSIDGDRATGPGVFDMKAGLVQMFHALGVLDDLTGVTVLVTSDEEIGSPTSRALIEREAAGARAALVLEASADGALKVARKGVSLYQLAVRGRAAHAGLEPESGINASIELAHQVLSIAALADLSGTSTVTPTVLRSGNTSNTVPDHAEVSVDVRVETEMDQRRIDVAMHSLRPVLNGAQLAVHGGVNRPPLSKESSRELFALASRVAENMGIGPLRSASVGGASDGNFTAGVGTPTLDGLGAVGGHAHAEGEWASVRAMPDRAALLARLIDVVRTDLW